MRTIAKLAIGAAMACGAAVAVAAPAAAQVSFGVGVGVPGAYGYVAPAPVVPAYSCYDAYGNYIYSYPYCTAYAAPYYYGYGGPVVEPYFGIGLGFGGGRHFDRGFRGGFERGHVAVGGGGHVDRHRG
jgi:hypothetical protein